ncbi:MAG: OmpA family protein [Acidimicrobiales bacterium]
MTELTEELDRLLAAEVEAGLLTGPNGIDSEEDAMTAAKLAQPLVVNALADWAIDAGSNLVTYLSSAGTDDDQLAEEDEPGRRLFGKRLVPATTAVAVETGLSEGSATSVVDAMSARSAKALAKRMSEEGLSKQDLAQLLRQERAALVENGWGPWIEMVGRGEHLTEPNTVSTPLNSATSVTVGAAAAAAGHDAMTDQGEAVTSTASDESDSKASGTEQSADKTESAAGSSADDKNETKIDSKPDGKTERKTDAKSESKTDAKTIRKAESPAEPAAEAAGGGSEENDETSKAAEDSTKTEFDSALPPTGSYREDRWDALAGEVAATNTEPEATSAVEDEAGSNKTPMLIGAACAAVLVGGGLFALLSGGDSEPDSTTDEAVLTGDATTENQGSDDAATATTVELDSTESTEATDSSSGATDDAGETVDVGASEIVQIQVPMTDVKGFSPESGGTADFEFNTETGEICYTFEAVGVDGPFATHIHVGAAGIRGGVVVDFGENESPVSGCIDNPPDDTADILAFPGSHYAELHDPSGDFTVRGQLSDETSTEDQRPDLAFTDPDAGGAQAVVESGRIVLRGPIADRETADLLAAEYASLDLAGIDVVDNLEIASDAPPPSGRVVLTDAILFAVGSSTLGATDQGLIDVLVAVALSEENSTMTIVGHTDSTGSPVANLKLSLERANTLRDVLVAAGVPIESLRVEGAGDTDPIGDNATAEGRSLNRRIEFELKPTVG